MKKYCSFDYVSSLFSKRIGDLLFLLWIIAALPILSLIASSSTLPYFRKRNIVYSLVFAFLVFIFSLSFTGKKRKTILWVMYLGTFFPAFIVLSYMNIASVYLMGTEFAPVYVTDKAESIAFMQQYFRFQLLLCWIGYFTPPLIYLIASLHSGKDEAVKREKKYFKTRISRIGLGGCVIIGIVILLLSLRGFQHIYFVDFYYTYLKHHRDIQQFQNLAKAREHKAFWKVDTTIKSEEKKVFVVVIGESLTRNHMHLYGYPRNTNPLLNAQDKDLLIFNDVVSGNTRTNECLKLALTFADNKNPDDYFSKPSIVELFKSAGIKTYWISAQGLTDGDCNLYGVIAKEADVVASLNREAITYKDEILFDPIKNALKDTSNAKVIFVHLLGSHLKYDDRYTATFNRFRNSENLTSTLTQLSSEQVSTINEYDNTVLYNDYVVSSIIDSLKRVNAISYLLYFSDHGDEVYDFRDMVGHHTVATASRYMCEVPFILWRSEAYKKNVSIDVNVNRPYDTEDLIYSVSQLSGLSYKDFDSTKSIFSKAFKSKERLVAGLPYDSLLRRFPGK